jgi:hypothetical protein
MRRAVVLSFHGSLTKQGLPLMEGTVFVLAAGLAVN